MTLFGLFMGACLFLDLPGTPSAAKAVPKEDDFWSYELRLREAGPGSRAALWWVARNAGPSALLRMTVFDRMSFAFAKLFEFCAGKGSDFVAR